MNKEWTSINKLALELGLAETTARRYVRQFSDFFLSRKHGKFTQYHIDCAPVLATIAALYQEGYTFSEIKSELQIRFSTKNGQNIIYALGPGQSPFSLPEAQQAEDFANPDQENGEIQKDIHQLKRAVSILYRRQKEGFENQNIHERLFIISQRLNELEDGLFSLRTAEKKQNFSWKRVIFLLILLLVNTFFVMALMQEQNLYKSFSPRTKQTKTTFVSQKPEKTKKIEQTPPMVVVVPSSAPKPDAGLPALPAKQPEPAKTEKIISIKTENLKIDKMSEGQGIWGVKGMVRNMEKKPIRGYVVVLMQNENKDTVGTFVADVNEGERILPGKAGYFEYWSEKSIFTNVKKFEVIFKPVK